MPLKKNSKKPIKKLKLKADQLFSRAIRYRDCEIIDGVWVGQCITCDRWYDFAKLQCGHFIKRSISITRFNDENCNAQCFQCNISNHGEQYKYGVALDKKYGNGTAKKLSKLSQEYFKVTVEFLEEVISDSLAEIVFYEAQASSHNKV